jgi:Protein of unknown function (DUF3489)
MLFYLTTEGHIERGDEPRRTETDASSFASEPELQQLASAWPMKRLVEIWNRLPGVAPVQKFENRRIAIARIWCAIGGEPAGRAVPSRRTPGKRAAFREGSKAAQVCSLLSRPEGATLNEIRGATGWQAHTVRGFISRTLREQGQRIRSFEKNGERVYRVRS